MVFQWKNRKSAVSQAAYQYRIKRTNVAKFIAEQTPEELEDLRGIYGPEWKPTFAAESTVVDCVALVLGLHSHGKFKNYFCTDAESISTRQYVQFTNDVEREIKRWDDTTKFLKEWDARVESA